MATHAPAVGARQRARRADRAPSSGVAGIPGDYLSITSYRRDGTPVATPVWFVTEGDHLLVTTDGRSGKAKRIRRNAIVTVRACSARGKPRGAPVVGRARILPAAEVEHAKELIARKYRVALLFIRPIRAIQRLFKPALREQIEVVLEITDVTSADTHPAGSHAA